MIAEFLQSHPFKILGVLVAGAGTFFGMKYGMADLKRETESLNTAMTTQEEEFEKEIKKLDERIEKQEAEFAKYKERQADKLQAAMELIRKDVSKIQSDQRVMIAEQESWRTFTGQTLKRIEGSMAGLAEKVNKVSP